MNTTSVNGHSLTVKALLRAAAMHPSSAIQKTVVAWVLWCFGGGLTQKEAAALTGCSLSYLVAFANLDNGERFRVARGMSILGRVRKHRSETPVQLTMLDRLVRAHPDAAMAVLDDVTTPAL